MHTIKITPNLPFEYTVSVYKRQIYQIAESNRIVSKLFARIGMLYRSARRAGRNRPEIAACPRVRDAD